MKRELVGILTRCKEEPCIKTSDGKLHLIYNLFDGLSGKVIRITVEVLE